MKGFCPLASGSKGNAVYLETEKTKILIDIGISYKELSSRLDQIGINICQIEAVLITHEHMDHIEGLKTLAGKMDLPIFANSETAKGIYRHLQILPRFRVFSTDESFEFKDLLIHPFSIQHDTLDPVAFVIKTSNMKIGICTDLGFVTSLVKSNLQKCDYLYLEANHDINMLFSSKRPESLKKRISGRQGHLSNMECLSLLDAILHPDLKAIFLAHQSQDCNDQKYSKRIVEDFLQSKNSSAKVYLTYQDKISDFIAFES